MAYWLLKTEPSTYSFADLSKYKATAWTGVANAAAQLHLKSMAKGDVCLIYHTGGEKQIVGLATVSKTAYPDPTAENAKLVAVDLKVGKALVRPVTLAEVKVEKAFAGWDLLRIGRLSVVPTSEAMFERVLKLAAK